MTPEQQQTLDEIIGIYRRAAPPGWLRIVCHWECELDEDDDPVIAMAHVVITDGGGELEQLQFPQPNDAVFLADDFQAELARETDTRALTIDLVIDRDGTHDFTSTEAPSKMLDGDRSEVSRRVHHYLENNRAELEALSARI